MQIPAAVTSRDLRALMEDQLLPGLRPRRFLRGFARGVRAGLLPSLLGRAVVRGGREHGGSEVELGLGRGPLRGPRTGGGVFRGAAAVVELRRLVDDPDELVADGGGAERRAAAFGGPGPRAGGVALPARFERSGDSFLPLAKEVGDPGLRHDAAAI